MKSTAASVGTHLYRALLHLYPPDFRLEFGEEMACDFEDATIEAWSRGRWASLLFVSIVLARDLVLSVALQWLRSGTPAVVAVSAAWAISCCALIAQGVPRDLPILDARNPDEDVKIMLVGMAAVVVLIAAIVLVTGWFWMSVVKRRPGHRRGA